MAFADVIADVRTYLVAQTGYAFYSDVPNPRPVEFVQIRRIGGLAEMPVKENVRLEFFTWAATSVRAMEMINEIRLQVWRLGGGIDLGYQVYQVADFMGPTQTHDSQTGTPQGWYRPEITIRANDVVQHSA